MAYHPTEQTPEPDWQEWIDRIGNRDVSAQELREFQSLLEASPGRMDAYLEALLTEVSLEIEGGLGVRTKVEAPAAALPAPPPVRGGRGGFCKSWPAVAACAALLVGLAFFLGRQSRPVPQGGGDATHVATITDSDQIADAAGLRIGRPLPAGEIEVPAGSELGIAMRGGARLDVNGPARLRIDGPDRVFLHSGRVQTYAPEYAHGFTINTDEGGVVDLGTRFVTSAGTPMGTEIHVLEGLVKARVSDNAKEMFYIGGEQAAILKDGRMLDTEFLARRLRVPLNPRLEDSDADGVVDLVEKHYGTRASDPGSTPALLRISESFAGYTGEGASSALERTGFRGRGKIAHWSGRGTFLGAGLDYSSGGKSLLTTGGCLQTTGEKGVGATVVFNGKELPRDGVIYISFLMQQPQKTLDRPFSGLLLYMGEHREQLFAGELSVADSYGSRYAVSDDEDTFAIPADDQPHLFVIRIDQTCFLTDVFVDPPLDLGEKEIRPERRYQNAPRFDRIMLRSGSDSGVFPVRFDELRVGLSWEAVLPLRG